MEFEKCESCGGMMIWAFGWVCPKCESESYIDDDYWYEGDWYESW